MRGVLTASNESSRELKHDVLERPRCTRRGPAPPVAFRKSTEASMTPCTEFGILFALFIVEPPDGMTAQRLYI
jgi:hypothetical protein